MMGRPRLASDDPAVNRRRAQYRNAKHRQRGRPEEPIPAAPDRRAGRPAYRTSGVVVRHVVTGEYVRVKLQEAR